VNGTCLGSPDACAATNDDGEKCKPPEEE
jgi:hypothetical protein